MDLVQLRTLIHVAELGSLSKAADRMRIAQPALSRQIRLLEEDLGAKLFERHGRGMLITDVGRQVLNHALRIMDEITEIRSEVSDVKTSLSGRVVIGMPPTVSDIISVPLVSAVHQSHPEIELRLVIAFTGYLLDWLQRGEIDLAVLYDPQPARSLRSTPLLLESLFLVGPADASLSLERTVPFARLVDYELLLPSPRHGLRALVEQCAKEAGITLRVGVEADSLSTLKDLVKSGHGATVLPLPPIHEDITAGNLTGAPLVEPTPARRLVLSVSSDSRVTRASRFTAQTVTMIVSNLVDRGVWTGQLIEE